jgi:hypothetical protein
MTDAKRDWLILSIKYTKSFDLMWWGPNFRGYTTRLEDAGRYTEKEARSRERREYPNGHFETVAVPEAAVEGRTSTVVPDRYMRDVIALSSAKGQFV